ncbi:isoprenylcysteine carboxylmethyltransferase family protein [Arthrobacter sp. LAPM80]|uniref:methyltransferase family protein n=1 Tax=Arthrobacter sp. LAPM80 TaxID=3141788 RepID=UPI00398A7299
MSKHQGLPLPPAAAAAAGIAQRFTPRGAKLPRMRKVSAVVVVAVSGAVLLATVGAFARRGTTLDPTAPSNASTLVTSGTNAISRNPMYVGVAGLLAAHALQRGSWQAWLPVGAFVVVMDRFQIAREEQALRSVFGEEYLHYCERTPRWLDGRSLDVIEGR